ncbi:MAG: HAMP domain-containing protein [Cyanobacteria bacterium SZAS-4]|nr:HAMP domain-containing protein [Cyanobacteria bacterium SZAS-4]
MFKNLATRYKLLISFSVIGFCILSIALISCLALSTKNGGETAAQTSNDLLLVAADIDAAQLGMMSANNEKKEALGDLSDLAYELRRKITTLNLEAPPQKLAELEQAVDQYLAGIKQYTRAFQSGDTTATQKIALDQLEHCKKIHLLCTTLAKPESTDHGQQEAIGLIAFIGVFSIFFAVFSFMTLCEEIAAPLQQLTLASERLAAGDLGANLPDSYRSDEVGSVVKAYARMVTSLRNISAAAQRVAQGDLRVEVQPRSEEDSLGKAFASMVENMSSATSQIKSAVEVLSSAVNNIMASVADSAAGATETATAVTETTTTVEEVRQTSHIANQKAKNVAESAQKSAQISTMGRKSTEETIQGMKRIREQMDLIADSMVRLSEKSQSIVEIIATVDDLAQQSNLLAVNASIEAAKAGELGRGFAVVAQEVKSMSDQSKQATAQVRKILGEIQQATTSAAMATELGSRAVDAAVTQSNQAGEAITTLANSVVESANAAAQIAVSSQQQLAGVDQVATAMLGIKDATAQNLIAIKRVEEATLTLQELGGTLRVLTKRYQL